MTVRHAGTPLLMLVLALGAIGLRLAAAIDESVGWQVLLDAARHGLG